MEYYTKLIQYFAETFEIKNNGTISDMIRGIKLYCTRQIKIANNQIAHAQKVDELFICSNKERHDKQIDKSQQGNTKQQSSDHGIGPR